MKQAEHMHEDWGLALWVSNWSGDMKEANGEEDIPIIGSMEFISNPIALNLEHCQHSNFPSRLLFIY
jgi:hypothetical protein